MSRIKRSTRFWLALLVWAAGIILFGVLGWWNLASSRKDAENRLINEAGRTAAQIAALLSLPDEPLNESAVRSIVRAAMEDESMYAIRIETRNGILEGQRRNYLWEPVNWDDEIAEDSVQGMNPIKRGGQAEGIVEVWLSPRLSAEEDSLLERRERTRFFALSALWTCALLFLLWYWGDLRRIKRALRRSEPEESPQAGDIKLRLGQEDTPKPVEKKPPLVSAGAGREFQRKHPDAWLVTAGMFRQTFGHAPELISRLYAEGEIAGLCHLGRMLEQAAPCIGAAPLAKAAAKMQAALNDPECRAPASAVEECGDILEKTLAALSGQWQTGQRS